MNDLYQAITWDTARAGGMLAYVLASASVCVGLLLSLKVRSPNWPRFVTDGLHRYVTLLALVFTGIHSLAVWLDPFTAFLPAEVVVPFASHYRPLWIGLGTVATYLLIAVWASEWIRPHVGYRWWRRLHYASFALFVLATLHGIGSGSDTATWWGVAIYAAGVGATLALLGWRLWVAVAPENRAVSMAMLGMAAFALAVWTAVMPLQPGWNAIANNGNGDGQAKGAVTLDSSNTGDPGSEQRLDRRDGDHEDGDHEDGDHEDGDHEDREDEHEHDSARDSDGGERDGEGQRVGDT